MLNDRRVYLAKLIAEKSDQQAFDELYRYYFSGLLSVANAIVKDVQIAEEMVEDVFVKLWENRKMLPMIKNLSGYLYTAVKHTSINYINSREFSIYRKNTVLEDISDDFLFSFSSPETRMLTTENLAEISKVIHQLPGRCRLIFRLVKEEGLKYAEVAELLNLSVKTVENQMSSAISRVVEKLRDLFPEYSRKDVSK